MDQPPSPSQRSQDVRMEVEEDRGPPPLSFAMDSFLLDYSHGQRLEAQINNQDNHGAAAAPNQQVQQPQPGEAFLELNDLLQGAAVEVDLNEPINLDDLGDLDKNPDLVLPMNVIEAAHANAEAMVDDIIEASSDSSAEEMHNFIMPDLNEAVHVEVFIPLGEDGHLQINPDEFPEDQLMDGDDIVQDLELVHEAQGASPDVAQEHEVMLQDMQVDAAHDPEVVLQDMQGNEVITMVEDSFSAEFHAEDQPLGDPEPSSPTTPSSEVDLRDVSPSTGPWAAALLAKAGKLKLSEEDPALRRSIRQKGQKKGYRHKSCLDKHCVACESKPPTISPLVIKNLGASFCDIDPAKLTDQALSKKKKAVAPMGKKPAPKKNSRDKDDVAKDKAAAAKKKAKK
nr:unnamed protein product [Digitaria exilis]